MLAPFSIIFFELLLIWDLIWGAFGPNLPQIVSKISQIVKNINKINLHENEAPALFPVGFQCAGFSSPAWLNPSPKTYPQTGNNS